MDPATGGMWDLKPNKIMATMERDNAEATDEEAAESTDSIDKQALSDESSTIQKSLSKAQ